MKKIYMIIRILTCKKVILISELSENFYKVSFGGLDEIEASRVMWLITKIQLM